MQPAELRPLPAGEEPPDPEPAPMKARAAERWHRFVTFAGLVATKSRADSIILKAAALAFVTILALIPLLAAFSFIGAQVIDQYEDRILAALSEFLPYSESAIIDMVQRFVSQAEALRGFGTVLFLLVGLGAFVTIEETINAVWQVSATRPLRSKLLSFTLVVFWGPLLIGSTHSILAVLSRRPELEVFFEEAVLVQVIPFAVTLVGLTMLYWQVPHTDVHFRSALLGGSVAAVLIEVLRRSFSFYAGGLTSFNYVVYGSFALAVFFMISIQIAWWAVLLGTEVAYVSQNFEALTRSRHRGARAAAPWIGLAALTSLADGLRNGRPVQTATELAGALSVSVPRLRDALELLLEAGMVVEEQTPSEAYVLACDPHDLTVADALATYDGGVAELIAQLPEGEAEGLQRVVDALVRARSDRLQSTQLVDLLGDRPEGGG